MAKSRVLKTQENRLTRGFGNGHSGVDLGWQTTQTDAVLAHSDGTVTFCQTGYSNNQGSSGNASYGNCVKLKHPNGYSTLYAHLSAVTVKQGQSVKKGQQIGKYFAALQTKPVSSWAQGFVNTVKERGVMNGDAGGNFRPRDLVAREELAAALVNALGMEKATSTWAKDGF